MSGSKSVKSETLKHVYDSGTVEKQRELYRDWADTYDAQTKEEFGWIGFKTAAEAFSKRVPDKSTRILDAGCGTGLSGASLRDLGYTNIEGRDLSPEMLEQANKTGAYKTLGEVDLTNPIKVENSFEAIFSSGVYGFGVPGPEHLHHLIATAEPGAPIIITVNGKAWVDADWEAKLNAAIIEHDLKLEENVEIEYLLNEDIKGRLLVFRAV